MDDLTILIVNYNSTEIVLENIRNLKSLTASRHKILLCDNGSAFKEFEYLRQEAWKIPDVYLLARNQSAFGSMGHGEALNMLSKLISTPYAAILDADCFPLMRNWDNILMAELGEKIKIIGTPVCSNLPKNRKPTDFPLMFLCLFESKTFMSLNIDFRPGDMNLNQDTGWQLRKKYLEADLEGKNLFGLNTREYKSGPFKDMICDEYYLGPLDKRIFCSHLGRGSNPKSSKYSKIPFIKEAMYKRGRDRWLERCRDIIKGD